jgi:alpha-tubulin suppressor-like RCC1 family protein
VRVGSNAVFTVLAFGTAPLVYRWSLNGTNLANSAHIGGATSARLTVTNVIAADAGNYRVVVNNHQGSTTSSNAALTVLLPPAITTQPTNQAVSSLNTATFSVTASGTAPLSFQWWFNGLVLPAQTNSSLILTNVQATNAGNYSVVVTNSYGSVTSAVATLTVWLPSTILQQPQSLSVMWGANAFFTVIATNPQPRAYQWWFNGTNLLAGQTNSTLSLTNVQPSQAGNYAVGVASPGWIVYSLDAALTVSLPPPGVPFITGFSPATSFPGTTVAIFGTNFSSTAASNTVYFGAVQAAVLSASVTNLVVTVPAGATFGPVTETVGGLIACSDRLFEPKFAGNGSNITTSSFAPGFNLGTAVNPGSAVIADLDGDGKPDIALVSGGSHVVCIFRNISTNGAPLSAASFAPRVDLPFPTTGTGGNPYRLRAVDLDGDGKLDLVAMEASGGRVSIFHNISAPGNLATNSFEPAFSLAAGNDCRFATAADLDGDGRPDLVVLDYGDKTISIFQNIGAAGILAGNSFASSVVLPAPGGPYEVVIADMDGDGRPDLAVANQDNNTVSIYQNFATPGVIATNSFAPRLDLTSDTSPDTLAAADMDGDGKFDLVVGAVHSGTIAVYRNTSSGGLLTSNSFAPLVDFGTSDWTHTVAVADFNGDGKPDITVVGELPSIMSIFQNASTPGSFTSSSFLPRVDFTTGYNAWGVAAGDLDRDGRPDIIFCNYYDNTLTICQNQVPFGGPPVILTQPANQTVPLNSTAQLAGTLMGQSLLSYQWLFNGTNLVDDGRITGSATGSLSISNALLSDSGNYYFVVTNSLGSATSTVASVTVIIVPPGFARPPQNQAAIIGSNAVFSATVSGSLPMAFQWFTDGGPLSDIGRISGSVTASLTIASVQTSDGINYWLVASNAAGMATSSVVNLTVELPAVITQQPSNQTVAVGSMVALTTVADGSEPFGYQWYFNNLPLTDNSRITGSMTGSLSISNAQTSDTGNYFALVTNLLTTVTSSVATVTVLVPPSITTQPVGRSSPLGLTNIFAASTSGAAPLSYQWQLNGTNIPGATNTSYFIAAVGTNDLGVYQFVASNAVGVAVSSNALLTVGPVAVWGYNVNNQCVVPPGLNNVTTIAGGLAYSLASRLDGSIAAWGSVGTYTNSSFTNVLALSASANGALALRSDGSVVGSGSVNPLSFKVFPSNVVAIAAGYGHGLALRAEGTVVAWGNAQVGGSSYSPAIVPPGLIKVTAVAAGYQHSLALRSDGTVAAWGFSVATNVPIGLSNVAAIAAGTTHSLALKSDGTLVAWGAGPGTNIPAGLSNVMTIAAGNYFDQRTSVSFAVRSNGTVVAWGISPYPQTNAPSGLTNVVAVVAGSYHALALVNDPALAGPLILRQPAGGTAWSGRDWTLQAAAAGAAPLNYQWLFNGTNLDGATNAALLLPAIKTNNAGNYQVVVSNLLGATTSLSAPIVVMDSAPFLLTQLATNLPVYLGSKLALSTAVAGSGPLQLQWRFNSNNIPGATNDTLNFDRVHLTNAGNYALVASNSFSMVTSAVVKLTVQQLVNWGDSTQGATNIPANMTNVAAISANFYGDMALRSDGTVTIWGNSGYIATNTAAAVSNVVEISAGYLYNLVLRADGKPFAWGNAGPVFSNAIVAQSNIVAIEAGNFSCALLKNDGTVLRITSNGALPVSGLTNAISVEPLDDGFIALRADGTVFSQAGGFSPPSTLTNVLSIASARYQGLMVKRDGRIQDWPQTLLPAGTSNIIAVAAGSGPEFAVRSDGTIMTGGLGSATNVPYGLARVWRLDAGNTHCLALLADRDFPPVFLHNALNTSSFVVSSKGAPQWFGQTNISRDGISAAQSAPIGNNLSSSMRMWIAGPVTVQFWWKVSSAASHGVLSFTAGGTVLTNISGEVDWQQCTVGVPAGNQILKWTYAKDGSAAAGQDAAWVDQLQLIPQPPVISTQPASQDVVGPTNVVLNIGVTGTPPLTFRWWKDGSLVPGANAASLTLLNAVRTNSGTYRVVVTNTANSVTSSNAVLDVRVPQLLGTPAFQPDGSILLSSTDVGGGQLSSADLANFQVQVSTNLVDWMTLSNGLTLTNGVIQLQDPGATNSAARYYRILENW